MFASREVAEEREAKAAEYRRQAVKSLKISGGGCLFVAILCLCALFYLTGYVAAAFKPDCVTPTHASTP